MRIPSLRSRRSSATGVLMLVAAALVLGACTGTAAPSDGVLSLASVAAGASATPSASAEDPQQAALDYASCMRSHGVPVADQPVVANGAGGGANFGFRVGGTGVGGAKVDPNSPAFAAAQTACQHFLAGITQVAGGKQLTPAQQSAFLAFAQCMRDHGVNMPDPQFQGGGVRIQISGGPGTTGIDPNMPAFAAAQTACQTILTNAGLNGPGGPPTSAGGPTTGVGGNAGTSGQP